MPPAGLGALALRQLAAWQEIASALLLDEVPEVHARCTLSGCSQSVAVLERGGKRYQYTDDELLALKVAHLRQAHIELDPDRG